jgi:hypothetical protein
VQALGVVDVDRKHHNIKWTPMMDSRKIESMFSELLYGPLSNLLSDECAEVKEFIDVGEYGIAPETLISIYLEERKLPDEDRRRIIDALAAEMSMDLMDVLLPEKE